MGVYAFGVLYHVNNRLACVMQIGNFKVICDIF